MGIRAHRSGRLIAVTRFLNPTVRLMLGATMLSFAPVFVRLTDTKPEVSAFYRVFFGACILLVCALLQRQRKSLVNHFSPLLIVTGLLFAIDLTCWHASINLVGPGLSTLLANFQVIVLTLIGLIFLKEKFSGLRLISVPIALIGLSLILGAGDSSDQKYVWGITFGLLAAFFYALYIHCLKVARISSKHKAGIFEELTIICFIAAAALAVYMLAVGTSFAVSAQDLPWLVMNGLIPQTIGWILIASSLPHLATSRVAMLLLLQPLLSYLWDVLVFNRIILLPEMLGATIALLAIYLGGISPDKEPTPTVAPKS